MRWLIGGTCTSSPVYRYERLETPFQPRPSLADMTLPGTQLGKSEGEINTGILIWFNNAYDKRTGGITNRVNHYF